MILETIDCEFSICKVYDVAQVNWQSTFLFLAKTEQECSVVCMTKDVPATVCARDDGWRAFRIQGALNFSQVGVLSKLSTTLSQNKIALFAISTYNTDYILIKTQHYERALAVLKTAGYEVMAGPV